MVRRVLWWLGAIVVVLLAVQVFFGVLSWIPKPWLEVAALVAGGPVLLAAAPLVLVSDLRFRGGAVRTEGTVESCEEWADEPSCTLTIRFTALTGETHVFEAEKAPRREPGQRVPVLYRPERPEAARYHRHPLSDVVKAAAMFTIGAVVTYFLWRNHLSH
ncbi:DUF3592 domain-containing protein [Actinomadura macrotermitis]|uniref:DUF3592 domain-containing protein n=1 Tax=Actinomadura macrotermitis TaxID=2585200 RepID=A0A7K0BRL6_9ACTN|nr:DUF3592 domain-containing protein [Actinomadura macrotermitis]MQY03843.1 hypothetical protein [Actinomadura macrotermitis]